MIAPKYRYDVTHTPGGCNWRSSTACSSWARAFKLACELPISCRPAITRVEEHEIDTFAVEEIACMSSECEPPFPSKKGIKA